MTALYLSDRQIAKELGIGADLWRKQAAELEREGLPRRDEGFGRRRYWPAVKAFLDRRNGLSDASDKPARTWSEHWERENA